MNKNTIFATLFLFIFILLSSHTHAQTIYKSDSGFFTPVIKSLYLRGGSAEDTQLIGPAIGYRFNETYDISLHAEFLNSSIDANNGFVPVAGPNRDLTMLNLGLIVGQTLPLDQRFKLRNELSVYRSVVFSKNGYGNYKPELTSGELSSTLFAQLPISGKLTLLPHLGGHLGTGNYNPTGTSAELRQGYDSFILGPQFGLDLLWKWRPGLFITLQPQWRINYNTNTEESDGVLLFNVGLNF